MQKLLVATNRKYSWFSERSDSIACQGTDIDTIAILCVDGIDISGYHLNQSRAERNQ